MSRRLIAIEKLQQIRLVQLVLDGITKDSVQRTSPPEGVHLPIQDIDELLEAEELLVKSDEKTLQLVVKLCLVVVILIEAAFAWLSLIILLEAEQ